MSFADKWVQQTTIPPDAGLTAKELADHLLGYCHISGEAVQDDQSTCGCFPHRAFRTERAEGALAGARAEAAQAVGASTEAESKATFLHDKVNSLAMELGTSQKDLATLTGNFNDLVGELKRANRAIEGRNAELQISRAELQQVRADLKDTTERAEGLSSKLLALYGVLGRAAEIAK